MKKEYSEALTALMDNLYAHKLGHIVNLSYISSKENVSDKIDTGLMLRKLLEESGFYLVRRDL